MGCRGVHSMNIEEPIGVLVARALSPTGDGWVLAGGYEYENLKVWDAAEAGGPKPTEAEWNAKIEELSGG